VREQGPMAEELVAKTASVTSWDDLADSQAALVRRCAEGDEQACASLVNEYQRMVYQLAHHLLGDHDDALDVSQEVFLRVFRTVHRFRGQSQLRTWIYRIVINQARNRQRWWRRRQRANQISLDAHVAVHGDPPARSDALSPERMLARKELGTRLQSALAALPFDQRTIVVLREIDGLSYDEIADSLGVTLGTVKSRLTRGRQTLRRVLQEERL
jgi:RNA polymerase sigma-70 factor, ECF subfamily